MHLLKQISIASFILVGLLIQSSHAQNIGFDAITSKTTVGEGERFRVEYKLNASGDQFQPPKFEGFRILSGPNQSTNMQFINGRSSYSISYSYVLMALKEGQFEIPSATIKVGSDIYRSNKLDINVIKGNTPSTPQEGNQPQAQSKQKTKDVDENLFIRATVTNTKPFIGEQITATYKLYFNFNIVDNNFTTLPSLTGFWSEDLDIQGNKRETEVVNGVRFNVATLKKTILIPQRSGELVLDPLEMDLIIQQPTQSRSRNIFDQFFGNYKNVKVQVGSLPVKVNVRQLPSGRPAGFDGAVGDFSVKLTADRYDVASNEAININYLISGKGNLKLMNEPKIEFPSDFEVYDPKVNDNITVNASGMSGNRAYNYLTIPRHKGNFTIEPLSFTYFNPKSEKYITLTTDPLTFNISKGEEESGNTVTFSGNTKEEIKLLGSDIRYIRTTTLLTPMGYSFFGTFLHYFLWILPIILFFIIWQIKRYVMAKRGDAVYMKKSKANKMAIKRLSIAKKKMNEGDDKKFYEEVFKALYGFFEDKFNISTSEINKERIREVLEDNKIDAQVIDKTEDLIGRCEMARFAPVNDKANEEVYEEAIAVFSAIQKGIK